jgi:amino acid permease
MRLIYLFLFLFCSCSSLSKAYDNYPSDNPVEELAEDIIEKEYKLVVDLSLFSPEEESECENY